MKENNNVLCVTVEFWGSACKKKKKIQTASKASVRLSELCVKLHLQELKREGKRATVVFVLPLPTERETTATFHSSGSAAGRRSLGLWVCGAVCTCCQAPPQLWPRGRCCCKTHFASSVPGHRSLSTESWQQWGRWNPSQVKKKKKINMTGFTCRFNSQHVHVEYLWPHYITDCQTGV